ncbi:homeobox-DDT domain protein RLT2 isoform X3 [Momordica charantia]|uniref:Homeobox-DDT domain protein RLT2 isoform X3 n=1 Tax=Momordica charantia TaxID=3673 RepID=A0A6J1C5S3_MOMCH|nr:homeobox-DDT domain protein RLT2 isoform X3 [Momordica charantia]
MECSCEGEKKPPAGANKIKRKMKTASQLEILEKAYTVEAYPSEALRAELSVKLGLSDRQLQMWFCYRRLKDRKAPSVKRPRKSSPAMAGAAVANPVGGSGEKIMAGNLGYESSSGLGMGSNVYAHPVDMRLAGQRPGVANARIGVNSPSMKRFYESQQSIAELRAMALIEAQLGEPLREDGPVLGMEFDPLPPGAFGAPIGATTNIDEKKAGQVFEVSAYKQRDVEQIEHHQISGRTLHEYKFLPEQPTVKLDRHERGASSYQYDSHANVQNMSRTQSIASGHSFLHGHEQVSSGYFSQGQMPNLNIFSQQSRRGHLLLSSMGEHDSSLCKSSLVNISMDPEYGTHRTTQPEYTSILSDQSVVHGNNVLWIEKKHKNDEARIAREVEAHEKRMRKELEKQDALRRKREEQIRKEMERHDRERQREEERLSREKQKEEERYLREQRRETLRREKFLRRESIRAERTRQKEALRREREAARLKAANQRAIARRMAKESMELADDERLELMELAVSSKGLPSIMSLDHETLENLELFEVMRPTFPPESVKMKMPFLSHPWTDSEVNVGNLLMVWKFLVTFADVLGLWPFTLDEFVQAFHDHDSRLLGEVHVALLRCIIKDIEDVTRSPSAGLGSNQSSAPNPGGGHLYVVEGAYAWGFDICSWQHHLNPLTWPEILRQLALSAGFGPQLVKGGNAEPAYLRDENEQGNDVAGIISNLRNGLAAENAVAIMHERGLSNQRRSRHRLTPGTVKFAAFHVLSLEGSKGLPVVEVADKIQKSGLRDLTTSRTPEASIAAALSRDSKLFERTAPSTYCVRSPYRRDPGDADAILSTARERIHILKSGFLDGEDAERNDDSEVDVAEDPEVDDLGIEGNSMKEHQSHEVCPFDEMTSVTSGKGSNEVRDSLEVGMENGGPYTSVLDFEGRVKGEESPIEQPIYITGSCTGQNQEDSDVGDHGEPWVKGLTEGEYSDLSVEERLNALCSLIGVALEGNSMRTVLEERLEAANSLKKQMLAEAQLDRRRAREEYVMQINESLNVGNKPEHKTISSTDARHSPIPNVGEEKSEGPLDTDTGFQQEDCSKSRNNSYPLNDDFPSEGKLLAQDVPLEADHSQFKQSVLTIEKSRSQLKSYIGHKAEEMYVYRSLPLGQDRRCNRYWQFTSSASRNEPGNGRIFVELHNGSWRLIDSAEGFDSLLASLDIRGIRESHLHLMLRKLENSFKAAVRGKILQDIQSKGEGAAGHDYNAHTYGSVTTLCADDSDAFDSSTSFRSEPEETGSRKTETLKRYHDFESWMRSECFSLSILSADKYGKKQGRQLLGICNHCQCFYSESSNHCRSCHETRRISDLYFSEHESRCKENISISWCSSSPLRIRLLKMLLTVIEASIPVEAFQPSWTDFQRKTWGSRLLSSSSAEELLQILTLLENVIKRDVMRSNYETTYELLACINPPGNSICRSSPETVPVLSWIPLTTAAVALRLLEFDASLSYILQQKAESHDHGSRDIKHLSNYVAVKNNQDSETAVISNEYVKESNWIDCGVGLSRTNHRRSDCKGGHGRTRGGKSQKRSSGSRAVSGKRSTGTNRQILRQVLMWKDGQVDETGGSRCGRRSIRNRQKSASKIKFGSEGGGHPEETIHEKLELSLDNNQEWNNDQDLEQIDGSPSSSDRLLSIDDNGGVEYDDMLVDVCARSRRSGYVLASRSYDMDEDKEDDLYDDGERGNVMDGGDLYVEQYINGEYNEESNKDLEHNMVSDEEMQSASSDYSI